MTCHLEVVMLGAYEGLARVSSAAGGETAAGTLAPPG